MVKAPDPAPGHGPGRARTGRGRKRRRRGAVAMLSGVVDRLGGARLCYGEPVRIDGPPARTVIPVARVRASGGAGWGRGPVDQGGGGGGGGSLDAVPMGYIEISPEGTSFTAIEDPDARNRTLKAASTALLAVATTLAGLRAARRGGRRLLGR